MPLAHHRRAADAVRDTSGTPDDRGTGLIGSVGGVLVFLTFLLLSTQILVTLYARSVVNAAGYDAARTVASRQVDHADAAAVARAQKTAERDVRSLLGRVGSGTTLSWGADRGSVRLRVQLEVPSVGLVPLARPLNLTTIDRTFVVRVEDLR